MKQVGVREFKTRLSQFLREVEAGMPIWVTDRGRVVAEVRPVGARKTPETRADVGYRQMVEEGHLTPAAKHDRSLLLGWKGPGLSEADVGKILDEIRGD